MNTILNLLSWKTILSYVTSKFLGVAPSMWAKAKQLVLEAETRFPATGSGEAKKAWVNSELKTLYKGLKQHLYDTVIGLAVQEVKK